MSRCQPVAGTPAWPCIAGPRLAGRFKCQRIATIMNRPARPLVWLGRRGCGIHNNIYQCGAKVRRVRSNYYESPSLIVDRAGVADAAAHPLPLPPVLHIQISRRALSASDAGMVPRAERSGGVLVSKDTILNFVPNTSHFIPIWVPVAAPPSGRAAGTLGVCGVGETSRTGIVSSWLCVAGSFV